MSEMDCKCGGKAKRFCSMTRLGTTIEQYKCSTCFEYCQRIFTDNLPAVVVNTGKYNKTLEAE